MLLDSIDVEMDAEMTTATTDTTDTTTTTTTTTAAAAAAAATTAAATTGTTGTAGTTTTATTRSILLVGAQNEIQGSSERPLYSALYGVDAGTGEIIWAFNNDSIHHGTWYVSSSNTICSTTT